MLKAVEERDAETGGSWEHEDLAKVRVRIFRGHGDQVKTAEFFFADRRILSAGYDGAARLWDCESGQLLSSLRQHETRLNAARLSHDQISFVTSGWDKKICVWDLLQQKPVWSGSHGGVVMTASYSWTDQLVVSGTDFDYNLYLWDTRTGAKEKVIKGVLNSRPTSCIFTPSDDRLVITSMDRTARFFDLRSGRVTITLRDHTNVVSCASITADERKLVTCSWDKTLQIYDISTGMYRSSGPTALVKGHEGCVSCCSFSQEGTSVVSGGFDNSIIVWDVESRSNELKLQGHEDWIHDVCFSSDREWILSASKDGTVRLWSIENAEKLPVVVENRMALGSKLLHEERVLYKCSQCGKPFSYSEIDSTQSLGGGARCVFCRLADPKRNITDISQRVTGLLGEEMEDLSEEEEDKRE